MGTNQPAMRGFSKTFSQMTDDWLLRLYLKRDELTPEEHSALRAELQKRSLPEFSAAPRAEHTAAVERVIHSSEGDEAEFLSGVFGRR